MFTSQWKSLAVSALLASSTYAIPTPPSHPPLNRRDPEGARLENGVIAFVNAYPADNWQLEYNDITDGIKQAFGVETTSKLTDDSAATNQPSQSPAQSHGSGSGRIYTQLARNGSEYLAYVQVGAQTLQMNLDTGSADLWVFSTALDSNERGTHKLYDPSQSNSHQAIPSASFKVSYGDNTTLTGDVVADTVALAGISVYSQAIARPTSFSAGIIDDPSDGIVGLGFQNLNSICTKSEVSVDSISGPQTSTKCPDGSTPNPRPTWFENAKPALKAGLFAVNFKYKTSGYYDIGTYQNDDFTGQLNYVPINNSKGYWQFSSRLYRVGGSSGTLTNFDGADGIADSGTSLLKLDPAVVQAYYAEVKGAQEGTSGWTFPCDAELPDLDIGLGSGYLATVEGKVINYAETSTQGVCFGGIQSTGGKGPQIFGDIFFKSNFVVFDYDGMRLGVAPHA